MPSIPPTGFLYTGGTDCLIWGTFFYGAPPLGRAGLIWLASLTSLKSARRLAISWLRQPSGRVMAVEWLAAPTDVVVSLQILPTRRFNKYQVLVVNRAQRKVGYEHTPDRARSTVDHLGIKVLSLPL